jgi:PilZ domain
MLQGARCREDAVSNNEQDAVDLRKSPRTWMRKKAAIRTRNGSLMHCMVMDLSRDGACLQIASTIGVAGDLEFSFDNFHSHRMCKVIWRKANRVGVEFIAE